MTLSQPLGNTNILICRAGPRKRRRVVDQPGIHTRNARGFMRWCRMRRHIAPKTVWLDVNAMADDVDILMTR
ncbi:hypothetical protein KCP70_15945 [Salmonella enterica subsp. enterica]|nr:hypothetical protein KCP70_15945 [Salmonella enterica subsp. enterica]